MSKTIEELLKNLTESGLLSADELSTVETTIASLGRAASVEKVARELVRLKVLTKLQAAAVMKGKTKNLKSRHQSRAVLLSSKYLTN